MNTKFLAAAAFAAALVPAIANADTLMFDPSIDSGSSPFVALPTHVNPANAAAAAADARRYESLDSNVVIGTHGVATQPQAVVEYDPGASDGQSSFQTKVIVPNPANAQAAALDVRQQSIPYADNSALIGN